MSQSKMPRVDGTKGKGKGKAATKPQPAAALPATWEALARLVADQQKGAK